MLKIIDVPIPAYGITGREGWCPANLEPRKTGYWLHKPDGTILFKADGYAWIFG